jgi:hypothetical protein
MPRRIKKNNKRGRPAGGKRMKSHVKSRFKGRM